MFFKKFHKIYRTLYNYDFNVVAMRELALYVDPGKVPRDPKAVIAARQQVLATKKTLHED